MYNRFKNLFAGLERAHGQYVAGELDEKGKKGGKAFIKKAIVTDTLWENHLLGKDPSLGIVPINDDSACKWGCIDVDTYPIDHQSIVDEIKKLELPLIVCRSKSGGAHIFVFTQEFVPAKLLRSKLIEWSADLGHANTEVFPKQISLNTERGDVGNFLNLPYFGGDESFRYAFAEDGSSLTLEEFLNVAEKISITKEQLSRKKAKRETNKELDDGPPCLQTLMAMGISEGGRDQVLYQYAVYAKKAFPDNWQTKIGKFNYQYFEPELSIEQVNKTIKQHEKQDYQYKCKDQPMCSVCNPVQCKLRKHGIGSAYQHQLTDLQKLESDEPVWFLNVDGKRIELDTDTLYDQNRFRKKCMDVLTELPPRMKEVDWAAKINFLLESCDIIPMPKEISKQGRFDEHLRSFMRENGEALSIDEVLIDKVFTDKEDISWFTLSALETFLKSRKFTEYNETQICGRIRELEGGSKKKRVKGALEHLWYMPAINFDSQPLPTKDLIDEVPF